nr:MAG TPA: Cytosine specific methyltransferase [Caudoviricetes sp.]
MTKTTNGITFLDFFAGIGGFRTAVERLGGKCLGFAEIDKHARQSYKALYNTEGEREWHDITQVTDTEFAELAGKVDLINAGFPCQAFSVAGKRKGFEDSRGTLFYEVARAAKAIRPKYILLENVKGLLSHDKGNTVDVIFRTLNEIGYTIDFIVLNSKHFGVPQNRERIFIMAVRDDLVTQEAWTIEGTDVVAKAKRRFSDYEGIKSFNFFVWSAQHTTVSKRLRDVLEAQVDEKFYLSDEKTAQLIEKMDDKVLVKEATRLGYAEAYPGDAEAYPGDAVNMAQPNSKTRRGRVGREMANTLLTGQEQAVIVENTQVVADLNHYSQEALNRIYGINGQSPTIDTMQGGGREPKIAEPVEVRATLTPDRAEKRQNGRRFKENDEPMFTLTAQDKHGVLIAQQEALAIAKTFMQSDDDISVKVMDNLNLRPHRNDPSKSGVRSLTLVAHEENESNTLTTAHEPKVYGRSTNYRIRKLTPLECWRLQGFSDEQHQKAVDAGVSNSQRYKQAGNSVTVNVIEAIVTQLIALDHTNQNESTEVA